MVKTKSTENFQQYLLELREEYYNKVSNKEKVDEWVDYIQKIYEPYQRCFIPHS